MLCNDCPRKCNVDREKTTGFCKEKNKIKIAKIIENFKWEEPCISGDKGALAIFFSGCNLRCSFCQNYEISHKSKGEEYTPREFLNLIKNYDLSKFSCIDLITPTHFSSLLFEAFSGFDCPIPIIWNSSGYENEETIEKISKFVDVFLPDLKYFSSDLSKKYSMAEDYFETASKAIIKMREMKKQNIFKNGIIQEGVLIRHLVLPSQVEDSKKILDFIKQNISQPFVSIMSQFTPVNNIGRKIFPLEYKIVTNYAEKIGLTDGYVQEMTSANDNFIPDF